MVALLRSLAVAADDMALLQAWRAGDRKAGDALFQRHFDDLLRFFHNKVGPDAAKDLIGATLIGCVEGRDRYRGDSSFRAYLFGTARYVLLGYFKKKKRSDAFDPEVTSLLELQPGPSSILGRRAATHLLAAALRRIPLDMQIVLELHYWQGLTSEELGRVLGMPSPSVRTRLRRARALLHERMQELQGSPQPIDPPSGLDTWSAGLRGQVERR